MKTIKNIFWVSYLENKGIRRICFIFAVLITLPALYIWYDCLGTNFYNETYKNITEFSKENRFYHEKQKLVYEKYPPKTGHKEIDNYSFDEWEHFFMNEPLNSFSEEYKLRQATNKYCNMLETGKKENLPKSYQDENTVEMLQDFCKRLDAYLNQEINVKKANYFYLLMLLWLLPLFYSPFLLCCIIKWVYIGFKQQR